MPKFEVLYIEVPVKNDVKTKVCNDNFDFITKKIIKNSVNISQIIDTDILNLSKFVLERNSV
jgi:hypothetical protein